jgi:YVTN family beta-propeller protein
VLRRIAPLLVTLGLLAACAANDVTTTGPTTTIASTTTTAAVEVAATESTESTTTIAPMTTEVTSAIANMLPGVPPVLDATNLYSKTAAGKPMPAGRPLVYVPSNDSGFVTVIDPATFETVDEYRVGDLIQHVVPSHDLRTLYANVSGSNLLVPFDPTTGEPGEAIPVDAPYNLYFTPDGTYAVVMAERRNRIDYYDPVTWERVRATDVPCDGPNHADWSPDGRWYLVTCEFSGEILKVDTATAEILGTIELRNGAMPQDLRIARDGSRFYNADMMAGGVWVINAEGTEVTGFIETGDGAHGVYPNRDASLLYVSNRDAGTVSVIDAATDQVANTWVIEGGGSPDMGGVTADGSQLWLTGRYHDEVYVFDTATGEVIRRIPVAGGPHGLAVFPQPGRYSLGHTGNYR